MKILEWESLSASERAAALARPAQRSDPALQAAVRTIVEDVRTGGWQALCRRAEALDGEAPREVEVAPVAAQARRTLSRDQLDAI